MNAYLAIPIFLITVTMAFGDTTYVSGNQSGEWTTNGSPYILTGNVSVPAGTALILRAGVRVEFRANHFFLVYGRIECLGAPGDSVFFTQDSVAFPTRWLGIRVANATGDASLLRYTVIEGSNSYDGAVKATNTDLFLENCTMRNCYGIGINIQNHSLSVEDCALIGNGLSGGCGGAIRAQNADVTINRSLVEACYALDGGALCFYDCELNVTGSTFLRNAGRIWGGAIYADDTEMTFTNCVFDSNLSLSGGAGYIIGESSATFNRCVFAENSASRDRQNGQYGVFYLPAVGVHRFTNCLFYRNNGLTNSVMYVIGNSTVEQSVFVENYPTTTPILSGGIDSMDFNAFHVRPTGLVGMPTNFGILVATNINGDSVDVYGNLVTEPNFNPSGLDGRFSLHHSSHLIDAGDPNGDQDLDGSIADLGPYPFNGLRSIDDLTLERVGNTDHLRLRWTAVPAAQSYIVFRSAYGLFDWANAVLIGEDTATVFVHLNALADPSNSGTYIVVSSTE